MDGISKSQVGSKQPSFVGAKMNNTQKISVKGILKNFKNKTINKVSSLFSKNKVKDYPEQPDISPKKDIPIVQINK